MSINLKNGLVLDDVKVKAEKTSAARLVTSADLSTDASGRKGKASLEPCQLPEHFDPSHPNGQVAFEMSATADAKSFSAQQMKENKLRVIQFARFNFWTQTYRGRKPSDGLVIVQTKGPLSFKFLLDCPTDSTATTPVNAPFSNQQTLAPEGTQFRVKDLDAPSMVASLDFLNRKTGRWNYLQNMDYSATFVTATVFVHKSGEIEPLVGVQWQLRMESDVNWVGDFPKMKPGTFALDVQDPKTIDSSHPLFARFVKPPPGSECALIQINRAISNLLTDPAIDVQELDNDPSPVADFWL